MLFDRNLEVCCNFGRELSTKETLIYEGSNFFICSAVGQMGIEGYVHISPKDHIESISDIPESHYFELEYLIDLTKHRLKEVYGVKPVFFENGPSKSHGDSYFRIRHAHIHVVPLDIDIMRILDHLGEVNEFKSLDFLKKETYGDLSYIWAESQDGRRGCISIPRDYPAGILRSKIGEISGTKYSNWRKNLDIETYKKTIEKLKGIFD